MKNIIRFILSTAVMFYADLDLFSQTILCGQIFDFNNHQPISGCQVYIYKQGILKEVAISDQQGWYSIIEIDPGTYTVQFGKREYASSPIEGVTILEGKINLLNLHVEKSNRLICWVTTWQKPLIAFDQTTQGVHFTSKDIRCLPF